MEGNLSTEETSQGSSDYPLSLYIGLHVIGIPLGIAIIVGNILLLIVFKASYSKTQKAFKPKTTVILTSISVGEIFAGLLLILNVFSHSVLHDLGISSTMGCYFWNVLKVVPLLGSFLHLTVLGVERYIIVNQTPKHPHMKNLLAFTCALWVYIAICAVLAFAFIGHLRQNAYDVCDIVTISPLYFTVIVTVQIVLAVIVCTALILVIRNTVKAHQRKIQVSNTIAYNNMIDDAKSAQMFYAVVVVSVALWLPFLVCQTLLVAGMDSPDLLVASRWSYLVGNIAYLKCYWYIIGSKNLRGDVNRTFGKADKRPVRMGTGRIREG